MAKPKTKDEREKQISHILAEVAGGRSVHTILLHDEGMPASTTFWRWHMDDESLRDNLARARENGIEALMEKAQHIAETPEIGVIEVEKFINVGGELEPATEIRHEDMLGHRKLQIDTLYKRAQMIAPRKYGPKLDVTSDGKALNLPAELEAARKRAAQGE